MIAGATGTLGRAITRALIAAGHSVVAVARAKSRARVEAGVSSVHELDLTTASEGELRGAVRGARYVVSSLGITRQRDGMTPRDVDFGVNARLADACGAEGVTSFGYVSVACDAPPGLSPLVDAKRALERHLAASELAWTVWRPSGFMTDFKEILDAARSGTVYLFGDGGAKTTPVDVDDLASAIAARLDRPREILSIGGPETMTWNDVATVAFAALGAPPKVRHAPMGVVRAALAAMRVVSSAAHVQWSFLSTAATHSTEAERVGGRTLASFFAETARSS